MDSTSVSWGGHKRKEPGPLDSCSLEQLCPMSSHAWPLRTSSSLGCLWGLCPVAGAAFMAGNFVLCEEWQSDHALPSSGKGLMLQMRWVFTAEKILTLIFTWINYALPGDISPCNEMNVCFKQHNVYTDLRTMWDSYLTYGFGLWRLPWISLSFSISFAFFPLLRKACLTASLANTCVNLHHW